MFKPVPQKTTTHNGYAALRHAPARDTQPRPGHPHFKLNITWVKLENMKHTPLTILSVLALALVGCGSTEAQEEPQSADEQQAQDNVDTSQQAYEEAYPAAEAHIINEYGITETAELCRDSEDLDQRDALVIEIMDDAGIQVDGTTRDDPDYRGAYDATDDAIYDTCEEYNSQ